MATKWFSFWCILLSSIILSSVINADYPSNGMSLEYCTTSENCVESRPCIYSEELGNDTYVFHSCNSTTPETESCFCRGVNRTECASSKDCPVGERCFLFKFPGSSQHDGRFCWTCRMQLSENDAYVDLDPINCEDVWLGGYTGDLCYMNYYSCAGDRQCVQFLEDGTSDLCKMQREACYCWPKPLIACRSSAECEDQERCATDQEGVRACFSCGRVEADDSFTEVDSDAVCSSPSPIVSPNPQTLSSPSPQAAQTASRDTPAPGAENATSTPASSAESSSITSITTATVPDSSTSTPPCISVVHLSEFAKQNLVFNRPIRAGVLCDNRDSCATPGHMVVFRNRAMTMASYCAGYATCSKRIAWVNNPRMRQALRVASHTEGLQFTALSARYETKIEEYLLKIVISSGI